ncbi:MAG: aspartate/glutamate racemase family protein [Bacteroidetes bacterium]|jgi:aspartate racemase|nr:aspartate/glutamate racemase family protein [Bacteroidota bacterium]MBT7094290.1 aspartate/glutamate racemase family protein [Bacteroidota bacterium]MBT7465195.1 aspartate/glutamate racemase family protein [Bacteroidota bacterium]
MKTIGMIGGMSWESSLEYYRILNEQIKQKLGGLHSAQCLMYSVDFGPIAELQHDNDWEELSRIMVETGQRLEKGGADFIIICTNTMHKMAKEVGAGISIPLIHIADTTAEEIKRQGLNTVALLGTRFTMEQDFYKGRLAEKHGLKVLTPDDTDMDTIHRIIYKELCLGTILKDSKTEYLRIIEKLIDQGAEGIILGCTEIPLLVKQKDVSVPILDTTQLHAEAAVEFAIGNISF